MRRKRNCEINTHLIRSLRYGRDDGLVGADDGLVGWHLLNGRCCVNEKIAAVVKYSFAMTYSVVERGSEWFFCSLLSGIGNNGRRKR